MSEKESSDKRTSTKSELALIMRKPLMLEASNEAAAVKRAKVAKASAEAVRSRTAAAKAPTQRTAAAKAPVRRPHRTISETTTRRERTPRPQPSASTRVIPVTTPLKARPKNAPANDNPKTKKANQKDMKLPLLRRIHLKFTHILGIILVIVLGIFFGRVAIWEHDYLERMEGSDRDTVASDGTSGVIFGGNDVDETEPSDTDIANYVVPPHMPRYFSIPSLGIRNARIAEVGLRSDGAVDVPRNAYMIGWYNGSVLPGQKGTSLLDAHGGDLGRGIFKNLPKIQTGATIEIEMGDGTLYTYVVADTATLPLLGANNADSYMPTALQTPQAGTPSLTLITCTGEWSQVRQTYLDRFFVRALLQQ